MLKYINFNSFFFLILTVDEFLIAIQPAVGMDDMTQLFSSGRCFDTTVRM
jgi:hypothetical protein